MKNESAGSSLASSGLLSRLQEWCMAHPGAIAVDTGTKQLRYSELDQQTAVLTNMLHAAGCLPGDVLAVLTEDRLAVVQIMLGILRAGGVFTPFDIETPLEQLRQRITWLQPGFLLTTDNNLPLACELASSLTGTCKVINVSNINQADCSQVASNSPAPANSPDYIYFTSGSTSQPKAIAGRLSSLAGKIDWEIETFGIPPEFRVSQLIAPTFDPWFRDVFVPLNAGGTICIPPEQPSRLDPERLLEWIREQKIQLIHCGPTLLSGLLSTPARIRELPDLKYVLLSGESLHVSTVARWRRRFGKRVRLVNLFGSTEATMIQFYHPVEKEDLNRGFIPIGRPLPDTKIELLNSKGGICTRGEAGEICIAGPALGMGYYRDKTATNKSFVVLNPVGNRREIFYRTGDFAIEFEPDMFRFMGRKDDQVKIRGVRVEPREVEDTLTGYPLVAMCAVITKEDTKGDLSLVACIVPETEYPPAVPEMRTYLRNRLPAEYLPASFVILKELPLTETGKIDRNTLSASVDALPVETGKLVPPRNALEAELTSLWLAALGLEHLSVEDHFLDLGGHSLSAARIANEIHTQLGLKLSIREIFDYPTIAAQAMQLEQQRKNMGNSSSCSAYPTSRRSIHAHSVGKDTRNIFACPQSPSILFGKRRCNLVIVTGLKELESFERIAGWVEELDSTIQTRVVESLSEQAMRSPYLPTLFFSTSLIKSKSKTPGKVFCGFPLSKSEEYTILSKAGVPVPCWSVLEEGVSPDLGNFGDYVIRKPDYGAKGAEVRIVRRDRVRWKSVTTSATGLSPKLLVQDFIYTGPWPVSYRVNTLFGQVLYAMRITGNRNRPSLNGPQDFSTRGSGNSVSIVSNTRDSAADLCMDPEIIRFGEHAAQVFPDLPVLGVDILKEAETGELFVTEVNSLGHNWNFTQDFRETFKLDIENQFNGMRKAAYILAEQTQKHASLEINS